MENSQSQATAIDLQQPVVLPECCDLVAYPSLKETLMGALAQGGTLRIDAGHVRIIGTPMMQLLAAAKRSFSSAGGSVMTITNRSDRFREVADMLGFTAFFDGSEN